MPYRVGEKGSYGCSGYPVLKEDDNTVMGCHNTIAEAQNQISAINISEAEKGKKKVGSGLGEMQNASDAPSVMDPSSYEEKASYSIRQNYPGCDGYAVVDSEGNAVGCYTTREAAEARASQRMPTRTTTEDPADLGTNEENVVVSKEEHGGIAEGDFVMGDTVEGIAHGRVEHIMWEGGVLGEPGTEYALESMPPENPAMSVRVYEQEDEGFWVPTAYSIGMMYQDAKPLESLDGHTMPEEMESEMLEMSKQESYQPTEGMKSAARRALKWKEEGKATGAGTPVGWGRATDIAAGRSMSLSVVKRMYSFFSRHEKASKGAKGFRSGEEGYPSNGRIMWDAWGGDAGFSWSRKIAEREKDKALFADFGKDWTKSQRITEIKGYKDKEKGYKDKDEMYKALRVGSMVSWNSSGGRAQGKITRILRSGSYTPPGTDVTITATEEEPAAVIRLYRDGEPTDTMVGHKLKTLREI